MNVKSLEIWQLAKQLVIDIHKMTLSELPKFEMVEEGAQVRRSVKSIKPNIVEGYGEENIIKRISVISTIRLVQ